MDNNDRVYFLNSSLEGNSLILSGSAFQALAPLIKVLLWTVVLSENGIFNVIEVC